MARGFRHLVLPTTMILVIVVFSWWRVPFWAARPGVFREVRYADAEARALAEERPIVLDATANWCGPCKQMDARTWPNARLSAWLEAESVPFQFDVDAEPELSSRFNITATPTVLVIRDGREVARRTGFATAPELMKWLEASVSR